MTEPAPKILDLPIGIKASGMREETDSLGKVDVPADRYWGAQTQRSLEHFNLGRDRMPPEVYHTIVLEGLSRNDGHYLGFVL